MHKLYIFTGTMLAFATGTQAALAEDCTTPCLTYELSLSAYSETALVNRPWGTADNTVIGPSNSLTLTATPAEGFNILADIVNEPVLDADPGQVNVFEGVGVYVDELYADYSGENFYFQAGKFAPPFSFASAEMGGNYGSTFTAGFDTDERWGVLAAYDYAAGRSQQRVTAAAFTADRTILSESAITNRAPGGLKLSDGGAGNTSGLSSALLMWDVCVGAAASDCYSEGAWGHRLGLRWQDVNHTEDGAPGKDEWSATASLFATLDVSGHKVKFIAEGDYTPNLGGTADKLLVGTVGSEWDFDPVTLYAALTIQTTQHQAAADTSGMGVDLAASYALAEGWTLDAGYAYVDTGEDDAAHYLNLSVTYDLSGDTGSKD